MRPRVLAVLLLVAAVPPSCASSPAPPPSPSAGSPSTGPAAAGTAAPAPAADPRAADDAALAAAASSLEPLEGHFLAVSGGKVIGGTLLREDTARLLRAAAGPAPAHAYFFLLGTGGDRRESLPALYADRLAGDGLLAALGLPLPPEGSAAPVRVTLEPASGLGTGAALELVHARGWRGGAILGEGDAAALGLARSGIPGTVEVVELLSGRSRLYRRALVRAAAVPGPGESAPRPPVLLEVLYPR